VDLLEVVKQRRLLLEAGVLEKLSTLQPGEALDALFEAEEQASKQNLFVISNSLVEKILAGKSSERKAEQVAFAVEKTAPAEARETGFQSALKIQPERKFDCTGTVQDFVSHFNNRMEKLSRMLRVRASENGLTTIIHAKSSVDRRKARIMGMVENKRQTAKGNFSFNLEDKADMMKCIASQRDAKLFSQAQDLWLDEVVAVDGFYSNGIFMVEGIIFPDVPIRPKKLADVNEDICIAFLSDMHVGSRFFLQKEFERMLEFLNGVGLEGKEAELSKSIKYVVIAGDMVDGVGVYPTQEKQLVTKNIFEQYELLGKYLKTIPGDIQVVISPGNHDAVRDAEPQPSLPSEFVHSFTQENFHFVPNPSMVEIHGIRILMYHGASVDALIAKSEKLGDAYDHPEKVAVELLKRRHLSVTYGENPLVPSAEDGMVIETVPDIFHFGHVHKNAVQDYKGTLIINSGTWQSRTDYQVKQGHHPSPCLMPVYNIRTGALKIIDFNQQQERTDRK